MGVRGVEESALLADGIPHCCVGVLGEREGVLLLIEFLLLIFKIYACIKSFCFRFVCY